MQRRRRHASPFLLGSLLIHLIAALIIMRVDFYDPKYVRFEFEDRISTDITRYARPEVRPRERIEPPLPSAEQKSDVEETSAPRPKPGANSDWLTTDAPDATQRTATAARVDRSSVSERGVSTSDVQSRSTARLLTANVAVTQPAPLHKNTADALPPAGDSDISISDSQGTLSADSPDVALGELRIGSRRGQALGEMPVGNSGGGGGASGTSPGANYIQMMTDIARGVTDAATVSKIDVVFIIDKTGSMEDNVRGVRAYVDVFFEHFTRSGYDSAFGLVVFADAREDKPEVRGVTTKAGKFKDWLYRIDFEGGGDLAESGLDALMAAVEIIEYRKNAQRFFVLASDAAFHDADYDGQSQYSQDQTIETLQRQGVRVDVIGLDYLPVKQIAWATGGTWRKVPGRGYLEHIPPTLTAKMLSEFGTLGFSENVSEADELVVYVNRNPRPTWLEITWKVLNPSGERCYGPFSERIPILNGGSEVVRFKPPIDAHHFLTTPGTYTIIYRLENNLGHRSILRRLAVSH